MPNTNRIAVGAMIAAAAIAAVVGCSNPGAPASSGSATAPAHSTSVASQPLATTSAVPLSPKPQPPGPLDPIDVSIAAQGDTIVRPGGPPLRFTVTFVNNGPDIPAVGMVVSLGHCSCGRGGAAMMPAGSMHMLDTRTNEWAEVPYDREGTGMDYITENLVPPFPLAHGETVSYQLEMSLDADADRSVPAGEGGINVTPTDPADPMRYGFRYAKYLSITVEP
jgi:hypothetical protein